MMLTLESSLLAACGTVRIWLLAVAVWLCHRPAAELECQRQDACSFAQAIK